MTTKFEVPFTLDLSSLTTLAQHCVDGPIILTSHEHDLTFGILLDASGGARLTIWHGVEDDDTHDQIVKELI